MKLFFTCILALLFIKNSYAQNIAFTKNVFNTWLDTRVGNGLTPTYWYCYGEVYSYPEGKIIAKMEGVDMARFIKITADSVVQISRKIFIYTDLITGQALETYNGIAVQHIQYPYQQISYVHKNNKLVTWVTQGAGTRLQTIGPGTKTFARKQGNGYIFSAPLFLNIVTPKGTYEAYENYDFVTSPKEKKMADKYKLYWNRFGDLPPFAGLGKSIIQLVCNRVPTWSDLSQPLKKYITEKAPLWKDAPLNLAEIESLQK